MAVAACQPSSQPSTLPRDSPRKGSLLLHIRVNELCPLTARLVRSSSSRPTLSSHAVRLSARHWGGGHQSRAWAPPELSSLLSLTSFPPKPLKIPPHESRVCRVPAVGPARWRLGESDAPTIRAQGLFGLSRLTLRSLSLSDILLYAPSGEAVARVTRPLSASCASSSVPGRLQPPNSEGLPYKAVI